MIDFNVCFKKMHAEVNSINLAIIFNFNTYKYVVQQISNQYQIKRTRSKIVSLPVWASPLQAPKFLPVLLYGLEVCPLTKADQRSLDFVVIRFLMKLFCTSNMEIINACLGYFDFTLPSELLFKRYNKYLLKKGLL